MRASYSQHGGYAAALTFIESGERAAIDHIPKIKDRVFNSEDFKEGI
jgi:enoyl-CoA hydratase